MVILSVLGILLGFIANAFYVGSFMGFILYVLRTFLFVGIYLGIYLLEKQNMDFKRLAKRMMGYLGVCYVGNLVCILFALTHILKGVFLTVGGLICFCTIVAFIFEILNIYFKIGLLIYCLKQSNMLLYITKKKV